MSTGSPVPDDRNGRPPGNADRANLDVPPRWDPFAVLLSAFFALCAQAGITSTFQYIKEVDRDDDFDGKYYHLLPNFSQLELSMALVCVTYLAWLSLQYMSAFQGILKIPQDQGKRRVAGFAVLVIASALLYIFGLILEPPNRGMAYMAMVINLVLFLVPGLVLRGIVGPGSRYWSMGKSALGVGVFAFILYLAPLTPGWQLAWSFVAVILVILAVPFERWIMERYGLVKKERGSPSGPSASAVR